MIEDMKFLDMETGLNPEEFEQTCKPEQSFSQMIKQAISNSPRQRLFLTEIYAWILENYPYYKNNRDQGWRNSVRHSLSTTKEFVRIKETRHRYNRGSEWCLSDSNLGRWYLELTEEYDNEDSSCYKSGDQEFSRLIELSTLIPELSSSMVPRSPERPALLDLDTCPDYLLGQVPHPELYVINGYRRNSMKTPSPPQDHPILNENITLPNIVSDSILGSPLSRKTSPKSFEMVLDMDLGNEFLEFN